MFQSEPYTFRVGYCGPFRNFVQASIACFHAKGVTNLLIAFGKKGAMIFQCKRKPNVEEENSGPLGFIVVALLALLQLEGIIGVLLGSMQQHTDFLSSPDR